MMNEYGRSVGGINIMGEESKNKEEGERRRRGKEWGRGDFRGKGEDDGRARGLGP